MQTRPFAAISAFVGMALVVAVAGVLFVTRQSPTETFPNREYFEPPAETAAPAPAMPRTKHVPLPQSLRAQLNAAAPAGAPVINARSAEKLIETLVPIRNQALLNQDATTLAEFETGVALQADGWQCFDCPANLGFHAANLGPDGTVDAVAFVPKQTTYPAWFASEALLVSSTTGRTFREIIVMTREFANHPWRIAFVNVSEINGGEAVTVHEGASDATDFNLVPKPRVLPADLVGQLARQWQHQKNTGEPDRTLPFSADEGARFAENRQDSVNPNGLVGHYEYRVEKTDPVYAVGLADNATLVCGAIRVRTSYTPSPGGPRPVQNNARTNWGPEVAPGTYARVQDERIFQPCMVLPAPEGDVARVFDGEQALYSTGIK